MRAALSTAEINTLEMIGNPSSTDTPCRTHLEKLSRLDLIEPANCGPTLSIKGREILFSKK